MEIEQLFRLQLPIIGSGQVVFTALAISGPGNERRRGSRRLRWRIRFEIPFEVLVLQRNGYRRSGSPWHRVVPDGQHGWSYGQLIGGRVRENVPAVMQRSAIQTELPVMDLQTRRREDLRSRSLGRQDLSKSEIAWCL